MSIYLPILEKNNQARLGFCVALYMRLFNTFFFYLPERKNRDSGIDFLRGLAILLVLLYHTNLLSQLFFWGWVGVDLFFVLSGFLVSGILFKEFTKTKKIDAKGFLIRRGFKIYPLFYLYIITMIALFILKSYVSNNLQTIEHSNVLAEVFYFQNYRKGIAFQTWSLAIEEHFYLFLILIATLAARFKKISLVYVVGTYLILFILCLFNRYLAFEKESFNLYKNFYPTHLRMDALFFGVLLSYIYYFYQAYMKKNVEKYRIYILVISLLLLIPIFTLEISDWFLNVYGLPMVYTGFGGILAIVVCVQEVEAILSKWIGRVFFHGIGLLGFYSYSIYLWHLGIPDFTLLVFEHVTGFIVFPIVGDLFRIVFGIGLGIFIANAIEIPILRIRDRWYPRNYSVSIDKKLA